MNRSLLSELDIEGFQKECVVNSDVTPWDNTEVSFMSVESRIALMARHSCDLYSTDTMNDREMIHDEMCKRGAYTLAERILTQLGITNEDLIAMFMARKEREGRE